MTKTKNAFTLSEILLVLSVIGIVAALTIPTLVQKVSDAQYKSAWKKNFSALNQAMATAITNNGGTYSGACTSWDVNCFSNTFLQSLNAIKTCTSASTIGNCWHKNDGISTLMDGTPITWWATSGLGTITADGAYVWFHYAVSDCSYTSWTTASVPICGEIFIDVNGLKKPNVAGKDIFGVWVMANSIKPMGITGDGHDSACAPNTDGWSCSTEYLYK